MERAQRGDQAAFADLARSLSTPLFAVAHRILRDFHAAEDATQQAIVLIWRDLPNLRDPDKFTAWSYRVLVNVCYGEAQRGRRMSGAALALGDAGAHDPHGSVADRDLLSRAFERLRPEQRAVLVLQYYLDLDQAEIADYLGIPVGTVKSRASSARNALRAVLDADRRLSAAEGTA
ncbi:MAG TPA: RNA polymerase sigma factor [Candidatus Limnocylindrales bacterium]